MIQKKIKKTKDKALHRLKKGPRFSDENIAKFDFNE